MERPADVASWKSSNHLGRLNSREYSTTTERRVRSRFPVSMSLRYAARSLSPATRHAHMSENRDEHGQFTERVTLSDVLGVFKAVDGP